MKSLKNIRLLFLISGLCFLLTACVPLVQMKPEELTKSDTARGAVNIGTVSNRRAADFGGKSLELIGTVRGGYGNPFDLKAAPDKTVDVLLRQIARASLEHTGYSANQAPGKAPRLDIDILKFWCDGYQGYTAEAEIAAKVVSPLDGKTVTQKTIKASRSFSTLMGSGPMHTAFDELINEIQKDLVLFMESEQFKTAVQ